jgi:hypothetical protein
MKHSINITPKEKSCSQPKDIIFSHKFFSTRFVVL